MWLNEKPLPTCVIVSTHFSPCWTPLGMLPRLFHYWKSLASFHSFIFKILSRHRLSVCLCVMWLSQVLWHCSALLLPPWLYIYSAGDWLNLTTGRHIDFFFLTTVRCTVKKLRGTYRIIPASFFIPKSSLSCCLFGRIQGLIYSSPQSPHLIRL